MFNALGRLFRLHEGEARLVFLMAFLLFANSFALEVSDVVAVSGFLSKVGVTPFLIVYIITFILIMITAGLQTLIVDRYKRATLMRWMSITLAIAYIGLRLLFYFGAPSWLSYSLLYILSDQQWLFFPLIFWILANDIFDHTQAKRLFPLMATGGYLGQIAGLSLAAAAPALFSKLGISSLELLTLNVVIYVMTWALVTYGLNRVKVRETFQHVHTIRETLNEGWDFVKEVPLFRYLSLSTLGIAIAVIVLEYRFFFVSDKQLPDADTFQTFYSLFRLGGTLISLFLQGFITSRLISRLHLRNSFIIFPVLMGVGIAAMIGWPGLVTATIGFAVARVGKNTIDESARKALLTLVPEERRGRVSVFMDSYVFAVGIIIGAVLIGLVEILGQPTGNQNYYMVYLGVGGFAVVLSIWATNHIRRVYDSSMLNWRLKRRQRAVGVLDKLDFDS